MVSEHQPSLHGRVWDRGAGIWHMAHGACGPVVDTRHGICAGTGRTDVYRGVVLGICRVCGMLPRASALEGGECNTLACS